MARFLFWSDLHCEFAPFEIPVPGCQPGATPGAPAREEIDAILLPGDIDTRGRHVSQMICIWDLWRVPVLAVPGNHEPYGAKRYQKHEAEERTRIADARALGVDIDVLRRGLRVIGDTRVIGATLWTDMRLHPEFASGAQIAIGAEMNDYDQIKWFDEAKRVYRKMIPADTIAMHSADKAYILDRLAEPFDGRTLVMTHHLPVRQALARHRQDRRNPVDGAYASDLWHTVGAFRIDAWIHGHSHDAEEVRLEGAEGPVAFLSNMRGYPGEATRFDPLRVLDSAAPWPALAEEAPAFA
ncbi:metallophosphoesterase [Defluviimonas salinarum]|uniref:Metallophosphoesterase n=1 Tax=Defluviimonas salinarum TaxID=2992147 RepID=A0ABT3J4C7_9RHOB|nr:metallophosphoesterase [Defluviimonas salinarum]MCW3782520.1 metallophosphoesterase [Defluviimonas salinarum]